MAPFAHLAVQADKLALERAAVYHGGILKSTSGGAATVDVYDGLGTGGEIIDSFQAAASSRDQHFLAEGIALRVGLYVNIGDNVSAFTVYYTPVPGAGR